MHTDGYDDNGNLAWKTKSNEKWNYQFNSLDQLTKIVKGTKSGQTWTYTTQGEYWYGPGGMMVKSNQSGTITRYVYRGHDPLMEKTGSASTYLRRRAHVHENRRLDHTITSGTSSGARDRSGNTVRRAPRSPCSPTSPTGRRSRRAAPRGSSTPGR